MVTIPVCATHLQKVLNKLPNNKALAFIEPNDAYDEWIRST